MKKVLIFSLIMLHAAILLSATPKTKYRIIHSDSLRIIDSGSEYVTLLRGNVHFFYGETEFFSDFAKIYEKREIASLVGNVVIKQDTITVTALKATYYNLTDEIHLRNNVHFVQQHSDSTMRTFDADKVDYFKGQGLVIAEGSVKSFDEKENMYAQSEFMEYRIESGYGYMLKEPVLRALGKDSLIIEAGKIEFYKEYKKIIATFDVKTYNNHYNTTSDFLIYLSEKEEAIFLGEPKFFSDFASGSANEFHLYFEEKKIKKAAFQDSCHVIFATEKDKPKNSWIKCEFMQFDFIKNALRHFYGEGSVISEVTQKKTAERDFMYNHATSEKVEAFINESNEIESLSFVGSVVGKYKFDNKAN